MFVARFEEVRSSPDNRAAGSWTFFEDDKAYKAWCDGFGKKFIS